MEKFFRSTSEEDTHMTESSLNPDSHSDTDIDNPTPRWVKVTGIIFIVLVLAFVILHLSGGGFGRHMHSIENAVQQK